MKKNNDADKPRLPKGAPASKGGEFTKKRRADSDRKLGKLADEYREDAPTLADLPVGDEFSTPVEMEEMLPADPQADKPISDRDRAAVAHHLDERIVEETNDAQEAEKIIDDIRGRGHWVGLKYRFHSELDYDSGEHIAWTNNHVITELTSQEEASDWRDIFDDVEEMDDDIAVCVVEPTQPPRTFHSMQEASTYISCHSTSLNDTGDFVVYEDEDHEGNEFFEVVDERRFRLEN